MTDQTPALPALVTPSTTGQSFLDDATKRLREAGKVYRRMTEALRLSLGRMFYEAAGVLSEKDYSRLLVVGCEEFDVDERTIRRYRLAYQDAQSLPPPNAKSARAQLGTMPRGIADTLSAPSIPSAGEGAGSAAAVAPPAEPPRFSGNNLTGGGLGPESSVAGAPVSAVPVAPAAQEVDGAAATREGAESGMPTAAGKIVRPAPSAPSGGHGSAEEQDGDNRVSGAAAAVTPDDGPDTDTPGLRPTAPVGQGAHPRCPTRDEMSPDLQKSYDAAIEEWRSGRGRVAPPDDLDAIKRELEEKRASLSPEGRAWVERVEAKAADPQTWTTEVDGAATTGEAGTGANAGSRTAPSTPSGRAAHGAAGEPQTAPSRGHETRGLTDPPASVADLNILLLRIGRTPENFWFNADAYAFSKAFWVLDRENARRRSFGGNGSLKRDQVQQRPKAGKS